MAEFPKTITDGNVELRQIELTFDNVQMVYETVNRNREYFGEFLEWVKYINRAEDQFDWVKSAASKKYDYFVYVDGKFAGTIGLVKYCPEPDKRWCEIGYWMDREFAGRGAMTRAVKMLGDFVFSTGEFGRIQIVCDNANIASARVAEKAGYKMEGIMRQIGKMGTKSSGNHRVYSMLYTEWKSE